MPSHPASSTAPFSAESDDRGACTATHSSSALLAALFDAADVDSTRGEVDEVDPVASSHPSSTRSTFRCRCSCSSRLLFPPFPLPLPLPPLALNPSVESSSQSSGSENPVLLSPSSVAPGTGRESEGLPPPSAKDDDGAPRSSKESSVVLAVAEAGGTAVEVERRIQRGGAVAMEKMGAEDWKSCEST